MSEIKHVDRHRVRLDDGTCWAFDDVDEENGQSLNWILRYGRDAEVLKHRLTIASILSSYQALMDQTAKRRNEVVRCLRAAQGHSPQAKDR